MSLTPTGWTHAQSPEVPADAWATCIRRVAPKDTDSARFDLIRVVDATAAAHKARVFVLTAPTALKITAGPHKGKVDVFTDVAFQLPSGEWHRPPLGERLPDAAAFIPEGG